MFANIGRVDVQSESVADKQSISNHTPWDAHKVETFVRAGKWLIDRQRWAGLEGIKEHEVLNIHQPRSTLKICTSTE